MFEDVFHDDNECNDSDIVIANKEWEKMTNDCEKDGFRDGITEGRNLSSQNGFDSGYNCAFKPLFITGTLLGIIDVLLFNYEEKRNHIQKVRQNVQDIESFISEYLFKLDKNQLDNKLPIEINEQFEAAKHKLITICNELELTSTITLINDCNLNS